MPQAILTDSVLLPELELTRASRFQLHMMLSARKKAEFRMEVCPKCATASTTGYDQRVVRVKDSPIRNRFVTLRITKRRFFCKPCKKPFTEPIPGIRKGRRTTERYRSELLWACENFTDLKRVRIKFRCSSGFLYRALYEQLQLRLKKRQYPWPKKIGIDEHSFRRIMGRCHYASLIVDYSNKKIFEVVEGKTGNQLLQALHQIEKPENVERVVLDLCDPFKNFAKAHFPNAMVIADKFHVLRLLTPALNRRRKQIVGDRRTALIGRLLLRNAMKLDHFTRKVIWEWLDQHPDLKEIYGWKESLHSFYRIKGYDRAYTALQVMTYQMQSSKLPEVQTLRRTLIKWEDPILNYFRTGMTNARTEGYNNLAKLIQKRAFGYKSFTNYRLRLLNACA
jgi:transposase